MLRKAFGNGPPDPEDAAHQAFKSVIERGNYHNILNMRAFLWRTARNFTLSVKRSNTLHASYEYEVEQIFFPLTSDDLTGENILLARQQLKQVQQVIRNMPEKRRHAFLMYRLDGLTITEIGKRLGISRSTASQHIARAVADVDIFLLNESKRP